MSDRGCSGGMIVIDIVGVGPVQGLVRWAQSGKFGLQFGDLFDLGRLAAKKERRTEPRPWYVSAGPPARARKKSAGTCPALLFLSTVSYLRLISMSRM